MSGFDLSVSTDEESGNNTEVSNDDEVTRFEPNEVIEGYILGGEWARTVGEVTVDISGFDRPSIEWEDDLSDYKAKVKENDYNDQQKLYLLAMLFKSTLGAKQSEENKGYGPGWDTDKNPPKPYDNENTHYADVFRHLPAWEWEGLDGGEIDAFGGDVEHLGFDRNHKGPKLPVINGERVPIAVEEGDELHKAERMLETIDFDELTYCEENGSLQGTPSLGPSEDTSSSETGKAEEDSQEVFNLAENPERVNDVNVTDLRGQGPEELSVSNIDSLRTIQVMIRNESEGDTRKGAMERLKQRRSALQGDDEEEEEEVEEDTSDDEEEGLSDAQMNLASALLNNGEASDFEEAKQMVR